MADSGYTELDDHDALTAARRAARRAGMSVREWLEAAANDTAPQALTEPETPKPARRSTEQTIAEIRARLDEFARRHGCAPSDQNGPVADSRPSADRAHPLRGRLDSMVEADRLRDAEMQSTSLRRVVQDAGAAAPDIRTSDPAPSSSMAAEVKESLAEIANRQRALEFGFDERLSGHSDRIDHRIEKMAERLERRIDDTSAGSAIDMLEGRLRAIAERLEENPATPAPELTRQLTAMVRRLEELPPRLAEELASRLDDTARRLDTATRSEVDSIRAEMREIAQEIDRATRSGFDAVHARLAELSDQIKTRPAPDGASAGLGDAEHGELRAIRDDIRTLADSLENTQREGQSTLIEEFRSLAARIETASPDRVDDLERQLNALVDGIGDQTDSSGSRLAAIEQRIAQLADKLDTPPAWLEDLHRQLGAVADASDRASDASSLAELAEIKQEIGHLAARFDVKPQWIVDLERQFEAIADGMGDPLVQRTPPELAEIERQLNRLVEQAETESDLPGDLANLEQQIGLLARQLESAQPAAVGLASLNGELAELKASLDQATQSNASSIDGVQDTLDRIARRLDELDSEFEALAVNSDRAVDPQPAPAAAEDEAEVEAEETSFKSDDLIGRIEAVTKGLSEDGDDHTPLVPGSGRPAGAPSVAADEQDGPAAPAPSATREDFIAAARRAAQAASEESASATGSGEHASGTGGRLLGRLKTYRRPLLIAAAGIIAIVVVVRLAGWVTATVVSEAPSPGEQAVAIIEDAGDDTEAVSQAPAQAEADEEAAPASPRQEPRNVTVDTARGTPVITGSTTDPTQLQLPEAAAPASEAHRQVEDGADAVSVGETTARAVPAQDIELPAEEVGSLRLREAAAAGDAAAQFEVATRYTDGQGVGQDLVKAAYWYRLAAAQGLAPAQYRLGSMYEKGNGVPRDIDMARSWYQRAAEQGNRNAMHNLAVLYADGAGGEPDYEQAALWFRQSADFGLTDSQYNLAILHTRGLGVEQSLEDAYRWFAKAAAQGDSEAAAQQEEIARRLDPEALSSAKLAAQSWRPEPIVEAANRVPAPAHGWADPEPAEDQGDAEHAYAPEDLVRQTQQLLDRLGYSPGPIDGQMGEMTRHAVRNYQRDAGLAETGEATPELLRRLQDEAG